MLELSPPWVNMKHCKDAKKRKYNSRAAALRAGNDRYGYMTNAYQCSDCSRWHLTRAGTPAVEDIDPLIERLWRALMGPGATA